MVKFVKFAAIGLLLAELAVFALALIRTVLNINVGSGADPLGAVVIFAFLGLSLVLMLSLASLLVAMIMRRTLNLRPLLVWLALVSVLWIPAVITLLRI